MHVEVLEPKRLTEAILQHARVIVGGGDGEILFSASDKQVPLLWPGGTMEISRWSREFHERIPPDHPTPNDPRAPAGRILLNASFRWCYHRLISWRPFGMQRQRCRLPQQSALLSLATRL